MWVVFFCGKTERKGEAMTYAFVFFSDLDEA